MSATRDAAKFAIATELLSATQPPLAWSNLGDWTGTTDYVQACRQLAQRVGAAASLQSTDRVLDLACGHGASLALWPEVFGVQRVSGLELRDHCVADIRRHAPPGLETIAPGRFDVLPAPAALAPPFSAVLCVDAAYHASSLANFAAFAESMLAPRGRLAFTTLLLPADSPSSLLSLGLAQAGIPAASVQNADELEATLARQGFADIRVQLLDAEVLQGFATFVARRAGELSWRQRASAGWLKIFATGVLCGELCRRGTLHYALVAATRCDAVTR